MSSKQPATVEYDDPPFRKPTAISQMVNRYSAPEYKLMNLCLAWASEHGFNRPKYTMSLSTVKYYLGSEHTRNRDWLKSVAEGLVTKKIEWNALRQDRTMEWGICTFMAAATIYGNQFQFRLNPEIVERLYHPKLWGQFRLLAQIRMGKRYSLVIYSFLKDAMCRAKAEKDFVVEIELEDLRTLLGLRSEEYREYKFFNQFVLKPALGQKGEINRLSDLQVTYSGIREGRRVRRLKFEVTQKPQFQLVLDMPELGIPAPEVAIGLEKKDQVVVDALMTLLVGYGIDRGKAMKLISDYSEERTRENVQYVTDEIDAGKSIKNQAAYLVSAIERDFHGQQRKRKPAKTRNAKAEDPLSALSPARRSQLQREWEKFREDRAWQYFEALSESEQHEFSRDFADSLGGVRRVQYKDMGLKHPVIEKMFCNDYLINKVLKRPEEVELADYHQWLISTRPKSQVSSPP